MKNVKLENTRPILENPLPVEILAAAANKKNQLRRDPRKKKGEEEEDAQLLAMVDGQGEAQLDWAPNDESPLDEPPSFIEGDGGMTSDAAAGEALGAEPIFATPGDERDGAGAFLVLGGLALAGAAIALHGGGSGSKPAAATSYNDDVGAVQSTHSTAPTTDDTTPGLNIGAGLTDPRLYVDGVQVAADYDPATGTLTPSDPLAEGAHELRYTVSDATGNESAKSDPITITVDTTVPPTPGEGALSLIDDVGAVQGPIAKGGITDDARPTFSGTADAGEVAYVNVYDGAQLLGSAQVQPDGTWSFEPALPLASGPHNLIARPVDAAGNEGPGTSGWNFTLLGDAPAVPVITSVTDDHGSVQGPLQKGDSTDDATPTLSGAGTAGTTVKVYADGVEVGSAVVGSDGTWTVTTSALGADGIKNLTVQAIDGAGQLSPVTGAYPIVLDTSAPAKPAAATSYNDNVGAVQSPNSTDPITDDSTPGLNVGTGLTDPGLYVDGVRVAADYDPVTGTLTPKTPLAEGAHELSYTVSDAAGNESARSEPITITVITMVVDAPAAPAITSVTDDHGSVQGPLQKGDRTDDATPTLSGTGTVGTTVKVYADGAEVGSAVVASDGTWTVTTSALGADGIKNLTAQAINGAGQLSPVTGAYPIVLDTSAPAKPAVPAAHDDQGATQGPIANGSTTDDTAPTFSGSGEPGSTVKLYDGANLLGTAQVQPDGSWSFTPTTPLTDGAHSITTTLTDAAGNTGAASDALSFTVDTSDVTVTIGKALDDHGSKQGDVAAGGVTDDTTPTLVGTATAGAVVTIKEGAVVLGTATADGTGAWSFTLPAQSQGAHTYTAEAKNAAGTTGSTTFGLNIDTTAPAVPGLGDVQDDVGTKQGSLVNGASTDDTTPTIKGAGATPGDTINIYDNGQLVGSTQVNPGGTWSYTPTTPLTEGEHALTVSAVDPAGKESGKSPALTITVDTTAPSALGEGALALTDDVGTVQGPIAKGGVTDDARPTFSGVADAGEVAYVNVYDGTQLLGSAQVQPDGTWSFEPALALASGPHSFTAQPVDAAGNAGPATMAWSFTLLGDAPAAPAITGVTDDVGAVTGPIAKNATTDDTTPTISGTGTVGTTIKVFANGVEVGSTTVAADGTWSVTTSALTGDGVQNLTAQAIDGAGQSSPMTGAYPIVLDTSAPARPAAATATDDVGAVQGTIASGSTTDDATPTFSGTGLPGETVTVKDGGTVLGSATVGADGKWSFTPTTPLTDGSHSITTTLTDAAGNTSPASDPLAFTIDTTNVTVTISRAVDDAGPITGNIAGGGTTDDTTPTLVGTATPNATVTVKDGSTVLGTATADGTGAWSFTLPAQSQGAHTYTAEAKNAAGTTGSTTFGLNIDTTAPAVPHIGEVIDDVGVKQGTLSNGASTDDTTPTIKGTGAIPGDTINVYDNGQLVGSAQVQPDGTWSYTPTTPLTEGEHALTVSAVDPVGNESGKSPALTITVDTTAPSALGEGALALIDDVGAVQGPIAKGSMTDDARPTFSGTADASQVASINVYDGAQLLGSAQVQPDGTWSFEPALPLASGPHNLIARPVDAAGNEGPGTSGWNFTLLGDAPAVPAITGVTDDQGSVQGPLQKGDRTDDATPTLSGTGTVGTTVKVYADGAEVGSAVVASDGTWTVTTSALGADGIKNLTAQAIDGAGQSSPMTGAYPIVLDTSAPTKPAVPAAHDDQGATQGPIANGSTTDDTAPTFSGSGEPGSTVKLYDGANLLGTAQVQPDSTWSFTPTTPLADGAHSITTTLTDAAGNTSSSSDPLAFTIDTTNVTVTISRAVDDAGPITGNIAGGGTTDDTTPTLVGTATPNATVTVKDGSTVLGTATADGTGAWSFTLPAQSQGAHTYTAEAKNAAGTTGSTTFGLNIDTTAPAVPGLGDVQDDVGTKQGSLVNGASTDDTTPTLSGAGATPGDTINVYDNGQLVGSTQVQPDGTWSYTPTTPLTEGDHALTVSAVDPAGNESGKSPALTINVDTTAPAKPAAATSYNDNVGAVQNAQSTAATTDDGTPGLNVGTGLTDPRLYVDGAEVPATYDPVTGTLTPNAPLAEGAHELRYTVSDAAGNESPRSDAITITVDTTVLPAPAAPTSYDDNAAPVIDAHSTAPSTNDTTPGINVGTGLLNPKLYVNGTEVASTYNPTTGTLTPNVPLGDGTYNLTYTHANAAGVDSAQSAPLVLTVDTAAPVAGTLSLANFTDTGASATDGLTQDKTFDLSLGGQEAGSTVAYEVSTDGGATWAATTAAQANLADGSYRFRARVTDAGGNTATSNVVSVTVDATGPSVTPLTASATEDAPVATQVNLLQGASDANGGLALGSITYTVDGVATGSGGTALPAGFSLVGNQLVADTTHASFDTLAAGQSRTVVASYQVIDAAGNASSQTATVTVNGVNDAPVLSSITITAHPDLLPTGSADTMMTVLDLKSGTYSLTSSVLVGTVDLLNNNANFGHGGIYPRDAAIITPPASVTGAYLVQGHVAFDGYTPPDTYSAAEITTIQNWVGEGNVLISTNDHASYDQLAVAFGLPAAAPAGLIWTLTNAADIAASSASAATKAAALAILNGPFGSIHGEVVSGTVSAAYFNPSNLAAGDVVLAWQQGYAATTRPTMVLRPHGDGYVLLTGDEGIFRAEIDGPVNTPNEILVGNLFAWADSHANPPFVQSEGVTLSSIMPTVTDIDGGSSLKGWAITEAGTGSSGQGHWEYWSGSAWVNLTGASLTQAVFLTPDTLVRWNGSTPSSGPLSAVAVDDTAATAQGGTLDVSIRGGSTPYSEAMAGLPAMPAGYKDDVGAVQSNASWAATTDDTQPGLNVGAGLSGTLNLYVDGVLVAATYDPVAGTLTPNMLLPDGTHQLSYSVTTGGTEGARSPALTITVDTSMPGAGTLSFANFEDTGASASDRITQDHTFDLSLSGQTAGSSVTYEVSTDGGATWTATTAAQANLADGSYQFRAIASNAAGSSATSNMVSVTVDTMAPAALTIFLDQDTAGSQTGTTGDAYTKNGNYTVGGAEPGAVIQYSTDGSNWSETRPAAAEGANTIQVRQLDAAGNVGPSSSLAFTLDTATPAPSLTNVQNAFVGNSPGILLSAQQVNTTTEGSQSGPVTVATSNGGYFIGWYDNVFDDPAGQVRGQFYAANGTKIGNELSFGGANWKVNGNNSWPDMPMLSAVALDNGKVVLSWQTNDGNDGVGGSGSNSTNEVAYAMASLNGSTASASTPALANTLLPTEQSGTAIVATKDGGFFIAWYQNDWGYDPQGVVRGQFFNANGGKVGSELQLGTWRVNGNGFIEGQPPLTAVTLDNGNIAVSWLAEDGVHGPNTGTSEVAHIVLSGSGVMGAQSLANTTTAGWQGAPVMVATDDGGYFIAWYNDDNRTTSGQGPIRGQFFDSLGNKVGGEQSLGSWVVNEDVGINARLPYLTATALKGGKVVVGWQTENNTSNGGPTNTNEAAMILVGNNAGVITVGTQTIINTAMNGHQSPPVIAALDTGGFFATWFDDAWSDPGNTLIRGQYFDAQGQKVGHEILVSNYRLDPGYTSEQPALSVMALTGGKVVVSWLSEAADHRDGSGSAVFQTVINMPTATVFNGQAEADSTVTLKDAQGTVLGTAVTNAQGDWQITTAGGQAIDTTQPVYATVVDKAGNTATAVLNGGPSEAVRVTALLDYTGENTGSITRDNTLGFKGTLETALQAGEKVEVSLNGGSTWQLASAAVGGTTWSYDNTANPMALGNHSVLARITDGSGAVVATTSKAFSITSVPQTVRGDWWLVQNEGPGTTMESPAVIQALADGRWIAVWNNNALGDGTNVLVQARFVNADGSPASNQFQLSNIGVDTTDGYHVPYTAVTQLAGGNIVVTWVRNGAHGAPEDQPIATVIRPDGVIIAQDITMVQTEGPGTYESPAVIQALADGRWIAIWNNNGLGDNGNQHVQARIFNADGTPSTNQFQLSNIGVDATSGYDVPYTAVTQLAGGNIVVSWVRDGNDQPIATVIRPDGTVVAQDIYLVQNQGPGSYESPAVIQALADGRWIAIRNDNGLADNANMLVQARLMNADGTPASNQFQLGTIAVDGGDGYDVPYKAVTQLEGGNIVVTWVRNGDDQPIAAIIRPDGTVVAQDIYLVQNQGPGNWESPAVIQALDDGRWIAVWSDNGLGDDNINMKMQARIFNPNGTPSTNQFQVGTNAVDGTDDYDVPNFAVTQLENGHVVVTWVRSYAENAVRDQPLYAVIDVGSISPVTGVPPVVLDLNLDGVIDYGHVVMDVTGDGVAEHTAWVAASDGVLVWDKYGDAMVHDSSQYAFSQYGGNTDLEGLRAAFDTNGDGLFSADDALFQQFAVWQDLNQNGVSEAGEVRSLADWGIVAIGLASDGQVRYLEGGVTEFGRATATLADGSTMAVADVMFAYGPLLDGAGTAGSAALADVWFDAGMLDSVAGQTAGQPGICLPEPSPQPDGMPPVVQDEHLAATLLANQQAVF